MTDSAPSPSSPVERLAPAAGARRAEPFAGPDHPIRKATRQIAFDGAWDSVRARKFEKLFDGLAPGWTAEHVDPVRVAPVIDALDRGDVPIGGRWLELGSGTGAGTGVLAETVGSVVALDLSAVMLANAPAVAPRVQGDASALPFPDDRFDAVLMVNMVLFPGEVDRVLAPDGMVVWVNTLGDQTPIHLPIDDVVAALPGAWSAVTADAGTGFWGALRRG